MSETSPQDILDALAPRLARIPALDADALEAEHVAVLGRKHGQLTGLLKALSSLPPAERRTVGAAANALRGAFEAAIAERRSTLARSEAQARAGEVDLTMPGRRRWVGASHPVTRVVDEIVGIFHRLGFVRAVGPEAETDWYNFGALNFPADHPAMDMHDTLYLDVGERRGQRGERRRGRASFVEEDAERRRTSNDRRRAPQSAVLLRTHTSPVQIRTLLAHRPPIRVIIPGTVYRKDPFDPSHAPVFSQIELLAVDQGISFVDLKGTLLHFAHELFSERTRVRFRPSYFPFTEPSAEMDVSCLLCGGVGCSACKGTGWMEILGCGMVHPSVLRECGVDPETYTGFAVGMGPHRIAMLRYGIPDIRLLFDGDMRFLAHCAGGGR